MKVLAGLFLASIDGVGFQTDVILSRWRPRRHFVKSV